MHSTTSHWEKSFVESEERMLCTIAAFMHQLAGQIYSLRKMDRYLEQNEIEQRIISTLSLVQIIHVNVLQRKWLLTHLCQSSDQNKDPKDHIEMIEAIQELEQAITAVYNFISKHSSHKMKVILKQISTHYYPAVKIFIIGNPSPPPPWKPSQKKGEEK